MGQFQSNFQTAKQIATQMGNAGDTIQNATNHSIKKATRTTLSVNSKAQEANQQAVNNIHSVAQEFERMDHELHNTFR
ncbi:MULTISPECIES: TIGR04197 family type VII secretion effector [Bacillus cereus group]|uniref:TIGR04197 family type VII secretion effector n=1 Tax=Bacillus cytotoxicus (strain DSM 22905 / CIP 110041 / 391-98 / NVH 391-98) TaxID=315749 RepID=A7GMG5_BACCN|nr:MULTISPECIES: TIGR04197 family type VII secretion effector [Bacillus cereus group]ABS21323.1 conserved hypothetical protein [Bacillus cytotoxicus NVH 391-98]AWC27965.1 TIGR04197 family type VII secretion effector [Bacillus cytotoxicus]AWC32012.1 TIGR04197 family type VII secretion effector [Bacillus cytotoxicus]AWC36044.1 TIGR04197 family type VII secretion effector [Bacillus cytotoxicus]AWC40653.1 TIGR04197 family type VII secretion effector [Bacillus cytotoxicus]